MARVPGTRCTGGALPHPSARLGRQPRPHHRQGHVRLLRVKFNTSGSVTIGERCNIAMDVSFVTQSHQLGASSRRAGSVTAAPIVVGDGVWIGTRAMVLPGVTIGRGCVIAAGAVVSCDCEPDGLYAGVPAKRVKDLPAGPPMSAQTRR